MSEILERLGTALRDRYTLERQAGEGGMATVFLAEDVKHRRQVALKVMRPELAASIGSDRFLREIEMAARLQHPHIVPVYDSGAAEGFLYYVMPFVDGESLRERLRRGGSLPVGEAVRITCEAASALGYAHEQGIVHRDIKPENILLSGGHAVVADFGIARAVNVAAGPGTALTGLGIAIGTPAYMSPEQATAEAVDARSDQYSLACVTFEMLAGRPAFTGSTAQSIITANITGPRPRVRSVRKGVPEPVERVLVKALDTDPAKRYSSVTEFADALDAASRSAATGPDLRRWGAIAALVVAVLGAATWFLFARGAGGPVMAEAERIAVMPFRATGPGAELLGEGMVDLLSTNLNGVGGVQTVEPRTVLQQIQKRGGGTPDLEAALGIAGDLKAGSVLLGSVVATGSRVRLNADLYAVDGSRLAQAQVDGHADSVLALVDGLSIELMRSIWRSQEPIPAMHVGAIITTSPDAMREYLAGERFYRRSQWDSAAAHFTTAVDADSTFALAHYRLATAYGWIGDQSGAAAMRAGDMAVRFADRLPDREQTLVRAYHTFQRGDPAAIDTMRRYVQTYPEDADGWYLLGEAQFHARYALGLAPETLTEPFQRVLQIDSTLTPAAIHPIELALMYRDTAMFARFIGPFHAAGGSEELRDIGLAGRIVWGGVDRDSGFAALAANAAGGRFHAALVGALRHPANTSDSALAIADAAGRHLAQVANLRAMFLAGLGRLDEAEEEVGKLMTSGQQDPAIGAIYAPIWGDYAPEGWGGERITMLEERAPRDNPFVLLLLASLKIARGEPAAAGPFIEQALAMDSTRVNARMRGIFEATRGWRQMAAGDTTGGLQAMQRGLREAGSAAQNGFFGMIRYNYAVALASRPDTRQAGIRWLKYAFDQDPTTAPIIAYTLGKAYEAAGEEDAAAEAYGTFIRLWDRADPALQPRVDEARKALERLTAEPRT